MGSTAHAYVGAFLEIVNPFPHGPNMVYGCTRHGTMKSRYCPECGSSCYEYDNNMQEFEELLGDKQDHLQELFTEVKYTFSNKDPVKQLVYVPSGYDDDPGPAGTKTKDSTIIDLEEMTHPEDYIKEFKKGFADLIARLQENNYTVRIRFGVIPYQC